MKLNIFSYQRDSYFLGGMTKILYHFSPVFQIRFRAVQMETFADYLGQPLFFHCQRRFIQIFHIQILENVIRGKITEQRNFVFHLCAERVFRTTYNNVRLNAHALQFFDTGLGRFCLHFLRSPQIGDQRNMNENNIFPSPFVLELTDRFKERLAFDIAHGASNFDNGNFSAFCSRIAVEPAFDFICDMGDNLYGSSSKIAPTFFLKNRPVDFAGCNIGIFCQAFINKSLIVSQIQIGFCSIVCDKYFAVLYRIHSTGIYINVRVEFLHSYRVAPGL